MAGEPGGQESSTQPSESVSKPPTEINIFDESDNSIIDERDLLVGPVSTPIQLWQGEMIEPFQIIGLAQMVDPAGASGRTVADWRKMMQEGKFDFEQEDATLVGTSLPGKYVFIEKGLHRAAAAIKEKKPIKVLINNPDKSKYVVNQEDLDEIKNRISRGDLKGKIILENDRPVLQLDQPDGVDPALLLRDPDKLRAILNPKENS